MQAEVDCVHYFDPPAIQYVIKIYLQNFQKLRQTLRFVTLGRSLMKLIKCPSLDKT